MTHDQEEQDQEQVRRVLASVPAPDMPPEVAARLEARLADLTAERSRSGSQRTARRRWPALLAAAAVAVVVGIGVTTVLDEASNMDSAQESAGGESGARTLAESGGDASRAPTPGSTAPDRFLVTADRIELRSTSLREDVSAVVDLHIPRRAADEQVAPQSDYEAEAGRRRQLFAPCQVPATRGDDTLVAVRLDGRPATLVLREPRDGARVAEIYSCADGSRLLASTEVSAR